MLSYLEAGEADGLPALLIHGNFAGKLWWRELLARPAPNSRLIAPDLPGFGRSPGGADFAPSIPGYAWSLMGFLDSLGIKSPLLVGHSFGAAVAVELVLAAPERFPAMFLLSPAPLGGLRTPRYLYPFLESYRRDRNGLRSALLQVIGARVPPYLDELVAEARMMHPASFSGNARVLSDWNVDGQARHYGAPVLVASGSRDNLVSPSSARATARAFPNGYYLNLGDVGHSPQIESPALVRALLSRLLNRLAQV